MPEITPLGWFHTIVGILAILCGLLGLAKFRIVSSFHWSGQVFLAATVAASVTALMIYQRGFFGPAHILAVAALVAVFGGLLVERTSLFGKLSPYLQAAAYSGVFLCHMLPAITDGLMRLPIGNPVVTEFTDPLLQGFFKAFALLYVLGVLSQWIWLYRGGAPFKDTASSAEFVDA